MQDKTTKQPFSPELRISKQISRATFDAGALIYPGSGFIDGKLGDNILIAPPFTTTEDELDELFKRIKKAFTIVEKALISTTLVSF